MADEEEKSAEEKQEENKKKSFFQNRMVIIGIILVAQAGIALMLGSMISSRADKKAEGTEERVEEGGGRGNIVMLEDIVVNLKESDKLYYLKVTLGLEVASSEMQKEVEKRKAHMRDIVISLVSGKKVSELDSIDERNAVKLELLARLSKSLESGDLIQIYFSDFVIQ
jgi:flagellar FliL protein